MQKTITPKNARGFVLYEGPSVLDGAPIVVVAVAKSNNAKTGNMLQTFILRADMDPVAASKGGQDDSICGGCPHRHHLGGACYVNIGQAPLSVYRAYHRGAYLPGTPENLAALSGRAIRCGTYGDPAAVPVATWHALFDAVRPPVWTGYTHQAGHKNFNPGISQFCMISADTPKSAKKYQAAGLPTFRVTTDAGQLLPGEIECLADSQGVQCIDCGLCAGVSAGQSVAITVHGSRAGNYAKKYGRANLIAVGG
jgi:hypothetical protein